MHELSYIMKIIPIAVEAAQKEHIDNVSTVEIEVGEMTGALPELLEKAYSESIPNTHLKDLTILTKNNGTVQQRISSVERKRLSLPGLQLCQKPHHCG